MKLLIRNRSKMSTVSELLQYVKEQLAYLVTARPTAVNMRREADRLVQYSTTLAAKGSVDSVATRLEKAWRIGVNCSCSCCSRKVEE